MSPRGFEASGGYVPRLGDDEVDAAVGREDGHRRHDLELERGGDQGRHGRGPGRQQPVVVPAPVADASPVVVEDEPLARGRSRSRPAGTGPAAVRRGLRNAPGAGPEVSRRDPGPDGGRGAARPARRAGARASARSSSTWRRSARVSSSLPNEAYASATRARRNARSETTRAIAAAESRARTAGSTVSRRARISRRSAALTWAG